MVLVIQNIIGFILQMAAMYCATVFGVKHDLPMLFAAMFLQLAAFVLLYDLMVAPFLSYIEKIFYPDGFDTGSDFSRIDSLIYQREFLEAIKLLDEHIKEKPDSARAYLKKCQIQYDHLKDPDSTIATGYERLNSKEISEEDERLIFLVLDILEENQKFEDAKYVLKTVIKKLKHDVLIERLEKRLKNLG